tara:strand:+ start:868 stop:1338 length:471 start_codon:yes stop_codon:yes gene_type:complete
MINYTISRVIINVMEFLSKMKTSVIEFSKRLSKHEFCIILSLGLVIAVLMWSFSKQVDHHAEMIKLEKENAYLAYQLQNVTKIAKEQDNELGEAFNLLGQQGRLLNEQDHEIRTIRSALWVKTVFYDALVEYLKKIGEWPPKMPPPIDPDKLANSI